MRNNIISFFKSFSFFKGCIKTIAVLVPLGIGNWCDHLDIGVPIALSVVAISPSDIPGNRRHLYGGLLIATLLCMFSSAMVNLTEPYPYLLLPTMFVLTFFNAYISLYGQRATMVSFAGLFGIASTLAHLQTGWNIALYCSYILLGSVWYSLLAYLMLKIRPRLYSEQLLGKCFALTSQFFATRADLLTATDRTQGLSKLINLQTNLNENYEKLRDEVLDSRSKTGKTDYLQRQFLMFIELVDIFELALANPVQYEKVEKEFAEHKEYLNIYASFLKELAKQLQQMSEYIGSRKPITLNNQLETLLQQAQQENEALKKAVATAADKERLLMLRNFYIYIECQYNSIKNIRLIFENYYNKEAGVRDESTYRKFVSYQNYSWRRLKDHISLKSTFFRHALRLSVVVIIGYLIGIIFPLNNAYWIILTIFIIMRPGFGITKERSLNRAYGTIIGGVVSFAAIYLLPYPSLYLYIAIICMPIAFGLIQENYMYASVFITITAIFIFALINPDIYTLIYDRLLDTVIGVVLSFSSNYLLLPTWEHNSYKEAITKSIEANIGYLIEVKEIFNTEEGITTAYKVSRKEAVLALSNLNTTFQRMLQEPNFMQYKNPAVYGIIVIQQSFLATVASLGIRLNSKRITFPKAVFNEAIDNLIQLQQHSLLLLSKKDTTISNHYKTAIDHLSSSVKEITANANEEKTAPISMRETQFYWEQFNYLFGLSKNLEQAAKQISSL